MQTFWTHCLSGKGGLIIQLSSKDSWNDKYKIHVRNVSSRHEYSKFPMCISHCASRRVSIYKLCIHDSVSTEFCPARWKELVSSISQWNADTYGWNYCMLPLFSTLLGENKDRFPIKSHQECLRPNVITRVGTLPGNLGKKKEKMVGFYYKGTLNGTLI